MKCNPFKKQGEDVKIRLCILLGNEWPRQNDKTSTYVVENNLFHANVPPT